MVFRNPTVGHGKHFLSGTFVGFVPSQHAMEKQTSCNPFAYECDQNLWDAIRVSNSRTRGVESHRTLSDQRESHPPIRQTRCMMPSNPESIVQQVQHEVQNLLTDVTGPEARSETAYTVELTLFRRLLALGAALLQLFCVTRAAVRPTEPVFAPDGMPLTYHDQRLTTYDSVLGQGCCGRPYCTTRGHQGICPLGTALSLPARGYSDLLREWAAYGTTDASSRESQTVLERMLGLSRSLQALETGGIEAGGDVAAFYKLPVAPPPASPADTILVVQADGKGIPMVQPLLMPPPVRLGKGQKRTTKKAAVVTAL